MARISDLGRGGCYVDTFSPFPLKTGVKIRITKDQRSFVAQARVVYSKVGMGMGLQFTSVEPQQLPVLEKWLGELSGTAPCEMGVEDECRVPGALAPSKEEYTGKDTGYVLSELILTLMRKGALSQDEGKGMLARLLSNNFLPGA